MKTKRDASRRVQRREIVFRQALLPMEAAVLPAQKPVCRGVLTMVPHACETGRRSDQRAKIWVR